MKRRTLGRCACDASKHIDVEPGGGHTYRRRWADVTVVTDTGSRLELCRPCAYGCIPQPPTFATPADAGKELSR